VFRTLLRLRRACPDCGWIVEREPGTVTGAMYLIAVLSQLFAVALLVLLWLLTDWAPGTKVAVAVPLIALFCLFALPLSKGCWIAVEYYTDLRTGEAGEPGYRDRAYERR
jgi:uncharacterized protein (DUF983 family)